MSEDAITFTGDYPDYEAARRASGGDLGYESAGAVGRSIRRYGEVSRDPAGALANPLVTNQVLRFMAALSAAEPIDGVYHVYDHGGGYGAIYELFRHLYPTKRFHWTIVETPALVACGAEMGASDEKVFATEFPRKPYSLGISSGTLQCLPDPYAAWDEIKGLAPVTMVNRLTLAPFLARDRLTVQTVPSCYFAAKFPCWFFAPDWRERLEEGGNVVAQWDAPGDTLRLDERPFCLQGFLIRD